MTAVDWMVKELQGPYGQTYFQNIVFRAKEIERDQIMDAYHNGYFDGKNNLQVTPQQYYQELLTKPTTDD